MSREGSSSAEVVRFMSLFAKLKDWCDDSPDVLADLAKSDTSVTEVCNELSTAAYMLWMNERRRRALLAAPVDPSFIAAWRDYEERYESTVSGIWLLGLSPGFPLPDPPNRPEADLQWENADEDGRGQASGIEGAIDFAESNVNQDWRWTEEQESFIDDIHDGIAAWDRLKQETGFDLRGVFRRRQLVPFVLVPRHVSAKHGSAEKLSLLNNLQEAHDAFVFGASYAALALMRSIMEAVLRAHYGASGDTLKGLLDSVRNHLPAGANYVRLDQLRTFANAVLHLDPDKAGSLANMNEIQLEKKIVFFLFVLRELIERAPPSTGSK